MASLARHAKRSTNIWPGFVDALATLLMVMVFLLMVFVLAQAFLSEAISGRDAALKQLQGRVGELAELLALERKDSETLRYNVSQLSEELRASVIRRDDLSATIQALTGRAEAAEETVKTLTADLVSANKAMGADKAMIESQTAELASLAGDISALRALKKDLETKIGKMAGEIIEGKTTVLKEREISKSARAQISLLNRQMSALREQLALLQDALDISERQSKKQNVQISSLGKRLNSALASKVQELSRYRSEFFGRLRDILGNQPGVRIVGDRFVFQSEVLFETGSADLGEKGKEQLKKLALTLLDIIPRIPKQLDWLLRVDGHTDRVPINNWKFPSNWELSAARAISVVKFLTKQGIPPTHLAAAGFGEHYPLDPRNDEIANRRNRRIELKLTQR